MTITSKFNGKCKQCGGTIAKGEEIEWSKEHGSQHVSCPARKASSNGVNPAQLQAFKPQSKPQPQTSPPRFHHLEKAFHKAEAAEKKAATSQSPDHDPYWSILCQQAEHEEALCTAN